MITMTYNNSGLKFFPCRDCGAEVVWAKSAKTGKSYIATVKTWSGDETFAQRMYFPSHRCTPNAEYIAARAEKRAEAEALRAAATPAPVGRVRGVEAVVVKIVNKGDQYEPQWKMTVRTDAGYQIWMSVPKSLITFFGMMVKEGDRVTVDATLTPSDRDNTFAFGKMPKVQVTA